MKAPLAGFQVKALVRECGFCPFILDYAVLVVKNLHTSVGDIETQVRSLGQDDRLEEGMTTHSSIVAWRIPWTKQSGGLQSMGSQRVRHD